MREGASAAPPRQEQEQQESEESVALRKSYESNQWPHQQDGPPDAKAAGDPGRPSRRVGGRPETGSPQTQTGPPPGPPRWQGVFDKRSAGARTALELAESVVESTREREGSTGGDRRVATDSEERDEGFGALVDTLGAWAGAAGEEERSVLLVSCGWARGVNFELVLPSARAGGGKVRIVHENLLPTRGHSSLAPAASNDSYNTAGVTPEDELVDGDEDVHVDLLLGRLRASLPESGSLTLLGASLGCAP